MLHSIPDPFSVVLCPDLCQNSDHYGHLCPLPSGLRGWVWLIESSGRRLQGKERVVEVFLFSCSLYPLWCFWKYTAPARWPSFVHLLSRGSSGTIWPFSPGGSNSFLLLSVPQHPGMAPEPRSHLWKGAPFISLVVSTFWVSELLPSRTLADADSNFIDFINTLFVTAKRWRRPNIY